jgi:hypothetical protein
VAFHRERLHADDGAQEFQLAVSVVGADGSPKADARIDRRLVLRRAATPLFVPLSGASDPFDRFLVRVAVADDDQHYTTDNGKDRALPQAQWSVVTDKSHLRLYGTTAIPTGLFRLADSGHSGILTLSVGALMRLVALSSEGNAFPVGLEAGVMWLGIAGDTDPSASSRGAVALVVGPGISVPIANTGRTTQTSINVHAWFETEISRVVLNQNGSPFGFVFGPSISIGDVGTNL